MPQLLKRDDTVGEGLNLERWRITRKIGEGQFAEVYEALDTFKEGRKVALKMDRLLDPKTVEREAKVLKRLQPCPCVVRLLEQGSHEQRGFMIMELLGMNVADSRKSCAKDGIWDAHTARAIGQHLLSAITGMHQLGFIHRDIKPANFAITPRHAAVHEGAWHVIDFGLARRYVDEAGLVIPARADTAFRGSTTYASISAHDGEDLGRRDDLWSWLYIMVEMITGTLPWRNDEGRDREQVVRLKRECLTDPSKLSSSMALPAPLARVSNHLATLSFEADPDYALLRVCLDDLVSEASNLQPNGVAAHDAQFTGLEDIADTPLSPIEDIADTPKSPPPEDAAPPTSRPASAGVSAVVGRNGPSVLGLSNGMAPAGATAAAPEGPAAASPPDIAVASKRPRTEEAATQQARSGRREADQPTYGRPVEGNSTVVPSSRNDNSQAADGDDSRRDADDAFPRDRSPTDDRLHTRSREAGREYEHREGSVDRERDQDADRDTDHRRRTRDRDWERHRGDADEYDRDREWRDGTRKRGRTGESLRDADRGRYNESRDPRSNERATSARPSTADGFQLDVTRSKHVHKYVTRIKEGDMSDGARDCKSRLKLISLTEGLGLAAYVIDSIVDEVSSRDADQMATLLGELEQYVWGQKQRARHRAKRR